MKKITLLLLLFLVMVLSSCMEDAKITVQNNVQNAKLERISWDNYSVASSLMTGESRGITVSDYKSDFPKTSVVKFLMTRGGNQVYLETKSTFTLDINDNLLIVISDTTEVINPALQGR